MGEGGLDSNVIGWEGQLCSDLQGVNRTGQWSQPNAGGSHS